MSLETCRGLHVVTGRDGGVRAAKVRTSNGLYTMRPIVKLNLLNVFSANEHKKTFKTHYKWFC